MGSTDAPPAAAVAAGGLLAEEGHHEACCIQAALQLEHAHRSQLAGLAPGTSAPGVAAHDAMLAHQHVLQLTCVTAAAAAAVARPVHHDAQCHQPGGKQALCVQHCSAASWQEAAAGGQAEGVQLRRLGSGNLAGGELAWVASQRRGMPMSAGRDLPGGQG